MTNGKIKGTASAGGKVRHNGAVRHVFRFTAVYALRGITLLAAVSIISFALATLSPIDPIQQYILANPGVSAENVAKMQEYWGVGQPPVSRYLAWAGAALHGDFGISKIYRRPVLEIIMDRFPASLSLMLSAWALSGLLGLGLGCLMGMFRGRGADRIIKKICLLLCSVPTFWIGIVFLMVFSVWLRWFPLGLAVPAGVASGDVTILQRLHHLALPAITLSFLSFANLALHTREKLIDVLESDYVLFAKARGERPGVILFRHGLRNILIPAVTLQFSSFSELFGGSVLSETVFSYPGLGAAAAIAGTQSDIPLLLGITLFSALFVFTGNLIANILYGVIDPRIREGQR